MRFFFYSREHEPIHVHVKSAEGLAKFNVTEEGVEIVTNTGMRAKDLNLALMEILKRKNFYCCPLKVSEQLDIHPQCCCNGIADDFSEGKPLS